MDNIYKDYVVNNEIIVPEKNWGELKKKYSQEFLIQEISNAIINFDIKLPYRQISKDIARNDFLSLCNLDTNNLLKNEKWFSKFEQKYPFLDRYIGLCNIGNLSSDYFHQNERWKCDATGYPSPQKTWDNEKYRLTLFKALFSLNVKEINPNILRNIIGLRKYIATQFRPSVAKTIYDYFKPSTVLDFSMGWGDRIAGAYASEHVDKYIGIDPNINLFENYNKQLEFYGEILNKKKIFSFYCDCAENSDLNINTNQIDLIFTSPPYFDKEKYDQSPNQSYIKHKKFDDWLNSFLFESIKIHTKNLKKNGYLIININDIFTRKKLYNICDKMNEYIISTNNYKYIGAIGLRMPKRPKSISSNTLGIYGEPIWIYQKK